MSVLQRARKKQRDQHWLEHADCCLNHGGDPSKLPEAARPLWHVGLSVFCALQMSKTIGPVINSDPDC